MERLLEIVRANPGQAGAIGFLILVSIVGWTIETRGHGRAHR
jgi:hypothetical protein